MFYFHKLSYVQYLGEVDIFYTWVKIFLFTTVKKIIKIDPDFPKLWSQMYCHLFYGSQCRIVYRKCRSFTAGLKIKSTQLWKETQEKHKSKDNAIFL